MPNGNLLSMSHIFGHLLELFPSRPKKLRTGVELTTQ